MKNLLRNFKWLYLVTAFALIFASFSPMQIAHAQAVCEAQHIVQRGDTLSAIARDCEVSLSSLIRANPQIANPSLLFPGQVVYIPGSAVNIPGLGLVYIVAQGDTLGKIANRFDIPLASLEKFNPQITNPSVIFPGQYVALQGAVIPVTGAGPVMQVSPAVGQPGSQVSVTGSGFSANTTVDVTAGPQGQAPRLTQVVNTDANGKFSIQLTIPTDAQAGSNWTISAAAVSATAQFQVLAPSNSGTYTVQSGDTLSGIARRFGIPASLLLKANPQLKNSSQLTPGQVITIPSRITFAPGGTAAILTGTIQANSSQYFVLRALARQLMEVTASFSGEMHLAIYGADGTVLTNITEGMPSFRGTLPSTQDYLIALTASQSGSYGLSVIIPARISFAPGGTSATVTGSLAAHASQFYILRALAGQQMQVNPQPAGAFQIKIYGVDGTVLVSGMGNPTSVNVNLPSTQDYIVALSAGDQAENYSLKVTIPSSTVVIPNTGGNVYVVQRGDNLTKIAVKFNISLSALLRVNPLITDPDRIFPGQVIYLP